MANRRRRANARVRTRDLVTVAFAEDMDLAKQYKKMLNDNDIPAAIKQEQSTKKTFAGIAVVVPEDYLDEAHVMIEEQGSNDSFYDLAFQEDDYDNLPEDTFDDEEF